MKFKKIYYLILLGIILRITVVIIWGDFSKNYYWEYGEIAKNIIHGNGYSLFYMENSELKYHFNEKVKPAKSAYMPPGYVYFLVPFVHLNDIAVRNILIYLFHILFASIVIYLVYLLTKKIFNETSALIAAVISALLPEFIYAVLSFSPVVIYHLLILSLLILLNAKGVKFHYLYIAILLALTIYFRSEFVLFFVMIISFLLYQKKFKIAIKIFLIVLVFIIPWSIRNYLVFEKAAPLTTSFGLNLYRGNNAEGIGSWGEDETEAKISKLGMDNLELKVNKIYQDKAVSFIEENPDEVIKNAFVKLYYFWVYYPKDQRSLQLIYLIPSLILLILFSIGTATSFDWKKHQFAYIFFVFSSVVVVIFFPLARYQTMMKIVMIPFCAYALNEIGNFFQLLLKKAKNNYF